LVRSPHATGTEDFGLERTSPLVLRDLGISFVTFVFTRPRFHFGTCSEVSSERLLSLPRSSTADTEKKYLLPD